MWWNPVKVWACHGGWEAGEEDFIVFAESNWTERGGRDGKEKIILVHHILFLSDESSVQSSSIYNTLSPPSAHSMCIFVFWLNNRANMCTDTNGVMDNCWADPKICTHYLAPTVHFPLCTFTEHSCLYPELGCIFTFIDDHIFHCN